MLSYIDVIYIDTDTVASSEFCLMTENGWLWRPTMSGNVYIMLVKEMSSILFICLWHPRQAAMIRPKLDMLSVILPETIWEGACFLILFNLYTTPLSSVINSSTITYQLVIFFIPKSVSSTISDLQSIVLLFHSGSHQITIKQNSFSLASLSKH